MESLANGIAIVFVIHFCWSYYRNCYRKGYALDLWHFSLLNSLIVVHLMLPFSRSDLNVFAIGSGLRSMQAHVTQAYFISALGYAGLLVGGSLWRVDLGLGLRQAYSEVVELPARLSLVLLNSKPLMIAHGLAAIALTSGVLAYYFATSGFGFNLRGVLLVNPVLRAIASFASFYSVLIASYCLARFYALREPSMLVIAALIAFTQVFSGARTNVLAIFPLTILIMILRLGRRLHPLWIVAGVPLLLALLTFLDALRTPNFSVQRTLANFGMSVLYGNSYSDLRDFALVLSYWNGKFLYGLTYLAGLIAFVPRFVSGFRDTWALGVVTATMAGYSPKEHPGLRVGIFGEAYLNFGVLGVVALSLFIGSVLRLIDLRTKLSVTQLPRASMIPFSYSFIAAFVAAAQNSTGASSLYTTLLIFAVSVALLASAKFLKIRL